MTNLTFMPNKENKQIQNKSISFGTKRTDKALIESLSKDSGAIHSLKATNINQALDRLKEDSSPTNIRFLLNIAKNLQYGVIEGSALDNFLIKGSNISQCDKKQNENWQDILKNAINYSLEKNNSSEKKVLLKEFNKTFSGKSKQAEIKPSHWYSPFVKPISKTLQRPDNNLKERTKIEKSCINSRKEILNAPVFMQSTDNKNKDIVKKFVDHFIASSEISLEEKDKCLKELVDFVSDTYKINPQLETKKIEILAELLNDLVVKIPEEDILTIKKMSQGRFGMCAAISTAGKSMAHEYKLQHIQNIKQAMNDSPTMQVYDITDPNNEEKISVEKAKVDYNEAQREGLRLIDSVMLNYMSISDQLGNNSKKVGSFSVFDNKNYDMLKDSHIMMDLPEEFLPKQKVFRALNKIKSELSNFQMALIEKNEAQKAIPELRQINAQNQSEAIYKVTKAIKKIANQSKTHLNASKIMELAQELVSTKYHNNKVQKQINDIIDDIKLTENPEQKRVLKNQIQQLQLNNLIKLREPKELIQNKLENIIKQYISNPDEKSIKENLPLVYMNFEMASKTESELESNRISTKGEYGNQSNLFKIAAFNRVKTELMLDIPEKKEEYAKQLNVEPNKDIILKKLEKTHQILPRKTLDEIFEIRKNITKYNSQNYKPEDKDYQSQKQLYEPMQKYNKVFKQIEKSIPKIMKQNKMELKAIYKDIKPQLKELAIQSAKGKGHLSQSKLDSSGLLTSQYSRLKAQLTGEDYRIINDPNKYFQELKKGNGGGVLASMVCNDEFSGHAQYVHDVKEENLYNPETKTIEKQNVLYTDNTWGPSEINSEKNWYDETNHLRTDYGSGMGYKDGFLVDKNSTEGVTELTFMTETGIHKPNLIGNKKAQKLDPAIGIEYSLFGDGIAKGRYTDNEEKLVEIFKSISDIEEKKSKETIDKYIETLMTGNTPLIKEKADKIVYDIIQAIEKSDVKSLESDIKKILVQNLQVNVTQDILKPNQVDKCIKKINNELSELLKDHLNDAPNNYEKRSQLIENIESIVLNNIDEISNPAIYVNTKVIKSIPKIYKEEFDKIIHEIKGYGLKDLEKIKDSSDLSEKGINIRKKFDALSESSPTKVMISKLSVSPYCQDNESYIRLEIATNNKEIEAVKDFIVENTKKSLGEYLKDENKKTFKSLENLQENPTGELLVKWVDKKYQPSTDRELLAKINELKKLNEKEFSDIIKNDTAKDFDINFEDPYQILLKIRGSNDSVIEKLQQQVSTDIENKIDNFNYIKGFQSIIEEHDKWAKCDFAKDMEQKEKQEVLNSKLENLKPNITKQFIGINNNLQEINLDKFIKEFGDDKEVILAIKSFKIFPDEVIQNSAKKNINDILELASDIIKAKDLPSQNKDKSKQNDIISEINEDPNEKENTLKTAVDKMKIKLKYLSQANIRPRKQKEFLKLATNWVKEMTKHPEELEILNMQRKLILNIDKLNIYIKNSFNDSTKETINDLSKSIASDLSDYLNKTNALNQLKECNELKEEWLKELNQDPMSDKAEKLKETLTNKINLVCDKTHTGKAKKELEENLIKNNISKFPIELLEHASKVIPEKINSENCTELDQTIIEEWKSILTKGLDKSKLRDIDSSLEDLIESGQITQLGKEIRQIIEETSSINAMGLKDLLIMSLNKPKLKTMEEKIKTCVNKSIMPNTLKNKIINKLDSTHEKLNLDNKSKKLDSLDTFIEIFENLLDPENNNDTAKYLMGQLGLAKSYADIVLSDTWKSEGKEYKLNLDKTYNELINAKKEATMLNTLNNTFVEALNDLVGPDIENETKKLSQQDIDKFINEDLNALLRKNLEEKGPEYKEFVDDFKSQLQKNLKLVKFIMRGAAPADIMFTVVINLITNAGEILESKMPKLTKELAMFQIKSDAIGILKDVLPENDPTRTALLSLKKDIDSKIKQIEKIEIIETKYDLLNQIEQQKQMVKEAKNEEKTQNINKGDSNIITSNDEAIEHNKDIKTTECSDIENADKAMNEIKQQEAIDIIIKLVNLNEMQEEAEINQVLEEIQESDNQFLDNMLVDLILDKSLDEPVSTAVVEIINEKGSCDLLFPLVENLLQKNGKFTKKTQLDPSAIIVLNGVLTAISAPEESDDEEIINKKLISSNDSITNKEVIDQEKVVDVPINSKSKIFIRSNVKEEVDLVKFAKNLFLAASKDNSNEKNSSKILETFTTTLPNSGLVATKMMLDIALDKDEYIIARFNALNVLSAENSQKHVELFKDIILKPEEFTKNNTEKLFLVSVATNGLYLIFKDYPMYQKESILNSLEAIDIDKLKQEVQKEKIISKKEAKFEANLLKYNIDNLKELVKKDSLITNKTN